MLHMNSVLVCGSQGQNRRGAFRSGFKNVGKAVSGSTRTASFWSHSQPVREERETETETLRTGEPVCPLCLRDALILQQEKGK